MKHLIYKRSPSSSVMQEVSWGLMHIEQLQSTSWSRSPEEDKEEWERSPGEPKASLHNEEVVTLVRQRQTHLNERSLFFLRTLRVTRTN